MTTTIPDRLDRETHSHRFGVVEFRTRGAGVFFPSEKLQERIRSLSREELREANKAAWRVRRKAERDCAKYANATVCSHGTYDRAIHSASVAEQICSVTWRALNS